MTIDEMIAVLRAAKEGKTIIHYSYQTKVPVDIKAMCARMDYRVKPEPREWWLDFKSRHHAEIHESNYCGDCIHVREVLE